MKRLALAAVLAVSVLAYGNTASAAPESQDGCDGDQGVLYVGGHADLFSWTVVNIPDGAVAPRATVYTNLGSFVVPTVHNGFTIFVATTGYLEDGVVSSVSGWPYSFNDDGSFSFAPIDEILVCYSAPASQPQFPINGPAEVGTPAVRITNEQCALADGSTLESGEWVNTVDHTAGTTEQHAASCEAASATSAPEAPVSAPAQTLPATGSGLILVLLSAAALASTMGFSLTRIGKRD